MGRASPCVILKPLAGSVKAALHDIGFGNPRRVRGDRAVRRTCVCPTNRGWTRLTWIINALTIVAALLVFSVTGNAATLASPEVTQTSATFNSDAAFERVEHFVLPDPARLVVDLYGVSQIRPQPTIALAGGFRRLRSGAHPNKIRFVFEAVGTELPAFAIDKAARRVSVTWQKPPVQAGSGSQSARRDDRARVTLIEIVDLEDGASSAHLRSGALAPIAEMWRHQVRISVQPLSGMNEMKHFLLPRPNRLVLELIGVVPDEQGRSFNLRDGFRRLDVDTTQQSVRLTFEMGNGRLLGFDIIEAPTEGVIVVAWGALGNSAAK